MSIKQRIAQLEKLTRHTAQEAAPIALEFNPSASATHRLKIKPVDYRLGLQCMTDAEYIKLCSGVHPKERGITV